MSKKLNLKVSRRNFLKLLAAGSAGFLLAETFENFSLLKKIVPVTKIKPPRPTVNFYESQTVYSPLVKEDVKQSVEEIKYLDKIIDKNSKVVIKPNWRESIDTDQITTNSYLVEGVVEYLEELGVSNENIILAEGPCCTTDIEEVLRTNGASLMMKKHNIKFVHLGVADCVKVDVPNPIIHKNLWIPRILADENVILINMPKLKTQPTCGVSCALKNLMGAMPSTVYGYIYDWGTFQRGQLHRLDMSLPYPRCDIVHASLADINSVIKQNFVIVDAILVSVEEGFENDPPEAVGLIVSGNDPLAVDATIARRGGLDPNKIAHMKLSALKGIGTFDEKNIEIIGSKKTFTLKPPKKTSERLLEFIHEQLGYPIEVTDTYPYPEFNSFEEWKKIAKVNF